MKIQRLKAKKEDKFLMTYFWLIFILFVSPIIYISIRYWKVLLGTPMIFPYVFVCIVWILPFISLIDNRGVPE